MGVLCHLGEPGAPAGEVDGRCFLASCLHAAVNGGCLAAETGLPVSELCAPGVPVVAPSPPAPVAGPVAAGRRIWWGGQELPSQPALGGKPGRADVCDCEGTDGTPRTPPQCNGLNGSPSCGGSYCNTNERGCLLSKNSVHVHLLVRISDPTPGKQGVPASPSKHAHP